MPAPGGGALTRRRGLGLLLLAVVLAAAVGGLAVRAALQAADLATRAQALLQEASAPDAPGDASDRLLSGTGRAGALLDRADARLAAPAPRLVAAVPVLGRSLVVERAVVRAARSAVAGVETVAAAAEGLRGAQASLDPTRLADLAADLQPAADRATTDLRALRAAPLGLTPPVVGRSAREASEALGPVVMALRQGRTGAGLAAGVLTGPRRVMVALQNNAELRGTGGYAASLAFGEVRGGRLVLEPFRDAASLQDPVGRTRRVPSPQDYRQDYGAFLADTTLLSNWTMSPDVPDSAAVGARAAGLVTGRQPDLVLLLDVPALARLVSVTGQPVDLGDGRPVTGEELTQALLTDAYARAGDQTARRAALQAAATTAVQGLLGAGLSPVRLAPVAADLARGRHLALWSQRPAEQQALRQLGLTGEVGVGCSDLALVAVNNLNANKLDVHVTRDVVVDVEVARRSARVVQSVRLENRAPLGLVPYVAGIVTPGVARERVEVSLGPRARDVVVTVNGRALPSSVRRGPDRTRVATYVQLRRGRPVTVQVRYTLPRDGDAYRLQLLPQPLAADAGLRLRVHGTAGFPLERGVDSTGTLGEARVLELGPAVETRAERLRRWWREPVRLPG